MLVGQVLHVELLQLALSKVGGVESNDYFELSKSCAMIFQTKLA